MARKLTYKGQKARTWKAFSVYIRLRDADNLGVCRCCTCDFRAWWGAGHLINAGHAIPGRGNAVLFDETLVAAQCVKCNLDGGGQQYKFIKFLKKKYGWDDAVIEEKLNLRYAVKKYTVEELREMEEFFKGESVRIAKEKGLII